MIERKDLAAAHGARTPGEMARHLRAKAAVGTGLPNRQIARLGDVKPDRGMNWFEGPMGYLGSVICKRMEQIGYPSKVAVGYRSPEQQEIEFAERQSKARAWQSPHQFYEAVDICHKYRGWPADDDPYWDALVTVVENVEQDFSVQLVSGKRDWGWDFAHIEMKDWRAFRQLLKVPGGYRKPTEVELAVRFKEVLPAQFLAARYRLDWPETDVEVLNWQEWLQDPKPRPGDPRDPEGFWDLLVSIRAEGWPVRCPQWLKKVLNRT